MSQQASGVVLIVDDEVDLREAVAFDFERQGYQVLSASNGVEAYAITNEARVDVIVTDVRMAGGDGIALLRRLKERNGWTPVVILMTGYTDMGLDEAYELGADHVFTKPFNRKEMHAAVNEAMLPLSERWGRHRPASAGLTVERRGRGFDELALTHVAEFGRSGFFLFEGQALPPIGTRIAFRFELSEERELPHLSGQGIVRWVRGKSDNGLAAGYGVEFERLDDNCRELAARYFLSHPRRALVPRGRMGN